jgi:transposase
VVDDASVMLENIQRRVARGEPPLVAGVLGARQVTFAILATSATLIAVFVPISFLEGNVGRLFTEFGFVLAAAVAISTLVALTLCPALCTKLLKTGQPRGAARLLESGLGHLTRGYRALLARALDAGLLVLLAAVLVALGSVALYRALPQELTPAEDRGIVFVPVTAPQGATVGYTDQETRQIEEILEPLREDGAAERIFAIVGPGGQPHRAFVVVRLVEWGEREESQQDYVRGLIPAMNEISGVRAFPVNPAGLGQRGGRTPLQVVIGGPDYESVKLWSEAILARAEENEGLLNLETDFEENQPQYDVLIDRARADDLDIGVETIARTLQTMLASREITTYVDRGREYPVMVQARAEASSAWAEASSARAEASSAEALVVHLRLTIEKLKRDLFGARNERKARLIDQMELELEELEAAATEDEVAAEKAAATTQVRAFTRRKPARKPFPAHLPRQRVIVPGPTTCGCCGSSRLVKLGEDVTERLEVVPRQWKVVQIVREKFSCRNCEKISQAPAPFSVLPRGFAGPSLLAMILFEKYGQHQPLNRQSERYGREGIDLSVSTLADQVGGCAMLLRPLYELIRAHVFAGERVHGDDTPVPVLARGKTDKGRLWVYVRDDRPFAGGAPPAALFKFSRDRRGEHPKRHLERWDGVLQANAYAGFGLLYAGDRGRT